MSFDHNVYNDIISFVLLYYSLLVFSDVKYLLYILLDINTIFI